MKKKDSLERFVSTHRQEFDDLKAPSRIWGTVLPTNEPVHSIWKITAVAASALLLIALGYILGFKTQATNTAGWDQFEETEKYYTTRINQKMEQIKTLGVSDEVIGDIQILDDVYHEMRSQLMDDPNANPKLLLSTMIKHHKQKLEVMEKIVNRVDKYQSNEKDNHEM